MQFENPSASSLAHRVRASVRDPEEDVAALSRSVLADSGVVDGSSELSSSLAAELHGFGVLQPLLDDSAIEEIWVNGPDSVFCASAGVSRRVDMALSALEIRRLVERMLRHTGRRVDMSQPFVDASLPDGRSADVELSSLWRPPLVSEFFPAALRMSVSARSQAFIR
ncbi:hypothetical protein OAH31_01640 [Pontimonas sp.]|nr:hypothetical protein [Pontimonas sp.]MDB4607183.1 hypothetical protein [Pontimonas sp.]